MRMLLSLAFRQLPVNLMLAADQGEAEVLLQKGHPNLFLVDLHLDEENGLEVAERILIRHGLRIPIVLVTAEKTELLDEYVRLKRCFGYESKPISLASFGTNVLRYLVGSSTEPEPAPLSKSDWRQIHNLGLKFAESAVSQIQRFKMCSDSELINGNQLLQTAHNWSGASGIGCVPKVGIESKQIEKLVSLGDREHVLDIRLLLAALEEKFQQALLS